jgi:hypothetical protein
MRSSAIKGADKEGLLAVGITIRRVDDAVDVLAHQLAPFGIGNAPAADRRIQVGSRAPVLPRAFMSKCLDHLRLARRGSGTR